VIVHGVAKRVSSLDRGDLPERVKEGVLQHLKAKPCFSSRRSKWKTKALPLDTVLPFSLPVEVTEGVRG
jgi:hypothetical protein